jgi:hypothetical protein
MRVLLLILVCIGALVVIAAGVWVAIALTAAISGRAPRSDSESLGPGSQASEID